MTVVAIGSAAAIPTNSAVAGGLPCSPLGGILEVVEHRDGVRNLAGGEVAFFERDIAKRNAVRAVCFDAETVGSCGCEARESGRIGDNVGIGIGGSTQRSVGDLPLAGTNGVSPGEGGGGSSGGDCLQAERTRAGRELCDGHIVDVGIAKGTGAVLAESRIGTVSGKAGKGDMVFLIGVVHCDGLHRNEGGLVLGVGHDAHGDGVIVRGGTAFAPEGDLEGVGRIGKSVDFGHHGKRIVTIGSSRCRHVEIEVVGSAMRIGGIGIDIGVVIIGSTIVDAVPADGESGVGACGKSFKVVNDGEEIYRFAMGQESDALRPAARVGATADSTYICIIYHTRGETCEGGAGGGGVGQRTRAVSKALGTVLYLVTNGGRGAVGPAELSRVGGNGGVDHCDVHRRGAARNVVHIDVVNINIAVCRCAAGIEWRNLIVEGYILAIIGVSGKGHLNPSHRQRSGIVEVDCVDRSEGGNIGRVGHQTHNQTGSIGGSSAAVAAHIEGELQTVDRCCHEGQRCIAVDAGRRGVAGIEIEADVATDSVGGIRIGICCSAVCSLGPAGADGIGRAGRVGFKAFGVGQR